MGIENNKKTQTNVNKTLEITESIPASWKDKIQMEKWKLETQIRLNDLRSSVWKKIKNDPQNAEFMKNPWNREVYYVPIEDGKWNVVEYQAMYISKNNSSEILRLPIMDVNWKVLRYTAVHRYIPMRRPLIDPIDLVSLWWGILVWFLKWLTKLAPKVWINLSKTAVIQISKNKLLLNVISEKLPKDIVQNVISQWLSN